MKFINRLFFSSLLFSLLTDNNLVGMNTATNHATAPEILAEEATIFLQNVNEPIFQESLYDRLREIKEPVYIDITETVTRTNISGQNIIQKVHRYIAAEDLNATFAAQQSRISQAITDPVTREIVRNGTIINQQYLAKLRAYSYQNGIITAEKSIEKYLPALYNNTQEIHTATPATPALRPMTILEFMEMPPVGTILPSQALTQPASLAFGTRNHNPTLQRHNAFRDELPSRLLPSPDHNTSFAPDQRIRPEIPSPLPNDLLISNREEQTSESAPANLNNEQVLHIAREIVNNQSNGSLVLSSNVVSDAHSAHLELDDSLLNQLTNCLRKNHSDYCNRVTSLTICQASISSLPQTLTSFFPNLTALYIANTRINSFAAIPAIESLTHLGLEHEDLQTFNFITNPNGTLKFPRLTKLQVMSNHLTSFEDLPSFLELSEISASVTRILSTDGLPYLPSIKRIVLSTAELTNEALAQFRQQMS